MPEGFTYVVRVETRVVVEAYGLDAVPKPVGEYVVHSDKEWLSRSGASVQGMVGEVMAKNAKAAKVMAAGVDNTERNRNR